MQTIETSRYGATVCIATDTIGLYYIYQGVLRDARQWAKHARKFGVGSDAHDSFVRRNQLKRKLRRAYTGGA